MEAGAANEEPKWTSLRGVPGDPMSILWEKHARLSLIAKAYRMRLARPRSDMDTLPAAALVGPVPLPLPLDSEGAARVSSSSARQPPPPPLQPTTVSARLDPTRTHYTGLGFIRSSRPKPSAPLAASLRPAAGVSAGLCSGTGANPNDVSHAADGGVLTDGSCGGGSAQKRVRAALQGSQDQLLLLQPGFREGGGLLPESGGDEWNGPMDQQLNNAEAPVSAAATAAAPIPPAADQQPFASCLHPSSSTSQLWPYPRPSLTANQRQLQQPPSDGGGHAADTDSAGSSVIATSPLGRDLSRDLSRAQSGGRNDASKAAVVELDGEAGEGEVGEGRGLGGDFNDDDVVYVGITHGDPSTYGERLQAQQLSLLHRVSALEGAPSRPVAPTKQRSILHFVQSRPSQQPSDFGQSGGPGIVPEGGGGAAVDGCAKAICRRGRGSLAHGHRLSEALQPTWVQNSQQPASRHQEQQQQQQMPKDQKDAAALTTTKVVVPRQKAKGTETLPPPAHLRDLSTAPAVNDAALRATRDQTVGVTARSAAMRMEHDIDRAAAGVDRVDQSPFRSAQQHALSPVDVPTYQGLEAQPSNVVDSTAKAAATEAGAAATALPRHGSGSLFAFARAGSSGMAASAAAVASGGSRAPFSALDKEHAPPPRRCAANDTQDYATACRAARPDITEAPPEVPVVSYGSSGGSDADDSDDVFPDCLGSRGPVRRRRRSRTVVRGAVGASASHLPGIGSSHEATTAALLPPRHAAAPAVAVDDISATAVAALKEQQSGKLGLSLPNTGGKVEVAALCNLSRGSSGTGWPEDVAVSAQTHNDVSVLPTGLAAPLAAAWQSGSEAANAIAGSLSMRALAYAAHGSVGFEPVLRLSEDAANAAAQPCQHNGNERDERQLQPNLQPQLHVLTPRGVQPTYLWPQLPDAATPVSKHGNRCNDGIGGAGGGGGGISCTPLGVSFVPESHGESAEGAGAAGACGEVYVVPATPLSLGASELAAAPTPPLVLQGLASVSTAGRCAFMKGKAAAGGDGGGVSRPHDGIPDGPDLATLPIGPPLGNWAAFRHHTFAVHGTAVVADAQQQISHTPVSVASEAAVLAEQQYGSTRKGPSLFTPIRDGTAPADGTAAAMKVADSTTGSRAAFPNLPQLVYHGRCDSGSGHEDHDELVHPGKVLQIHIALDVGDCVDHGAQQRRQGIGDSGCATTGCASGSGRDGGCYLACLVAMGSDGQRGPVDPSAEYRVAAAAIAGDKSEELSEGQQADVALRKEGWRPSLRLYTWRLPPHGPPELHSEVALASAAAASASALPPAAPCGSGEPCAQPRDDSCTSSDEDDWVARLGQALRLLVCPDGGLALVLSGCLDVLTLRKPSSSQVSPCRQRQHGERHGELHAGAEPPPVVNFTAGSRSQHHTGRDACCGAGLAGLVKVLHFQGGSWRLALELSRPLDCTVSMSEVSSAAVIRCLACAACPVLPPICQQPHSGCSSAHHHAAAAASSTLAGASLPAQLKTLAVQEARQGQVFEDGQVTPAPALACRPQSCYQIVAAGAAGQAYLWRLDLWLKDVLQAALLPPISRGIEEGPTAEAGSSAMSVAGAASEVVELVVLPHMQRLVVGARVDGCLTLWDVGVARAAPVDGGTSVEAATVGLIMSGRGAPYAALRLEPAGLPALLAVVHPGPCVLRCLQPIAPTVMSAGWGSPGAATAWLRNAKVLHKETASARPGWDDFSPVALLACAMRPKAFASGLSDGRGSGACVAPVLLHNGIVEVGQGMGVSDVTCMGACDALGVVGTRQGTVVAWDCKDGAIVAGWQMPEQVSAVAVHSRMVFAAAGARVLMAVVV